MEKKSTTRSVERVLEILDCFLKGQELLLLELSEQIGLPPSTVHRLAGALVEMGYLDRDRASKKFRLGTKLTGLAGGLMADARAESLRRGGYIPMEKLSGKYNENVRLFIPDGGAKLCIECIECTREIRQVIRVGDRHDLVRGAAGRVLLAYMDEQARLEILGDLNLTEELGKVRAMGYALSIGEREDELVGIAAPVYSTEGKVVGALSLSGPSVRFINNDISKKIQDTVSCAAEISHRLGYRQAIAL